MRTAPMALMASAPPDACAQIANPSASCDQPSMPTKPTPYTAAPPPRWNAVTPENPLSPAVPARTPSPGPPSAKTAPAGFVDGTGPRFVAWITYFFALSVFATIPVFFSPDAASAAPDPVAP